MAGLLRTCVPKFRVYPQNQRGFSDFCQVKVCKKKGIAVKLLSFSILSTIIDVDVDSTESVLRVFVRKFITGMLWITNTWNRFVHKKKNTTKKKSSYGKCLLFLTVSQGPWLAGTRFRLYDSASSRTPNKDACFFSTLFRSV